MFPTIWFEEHAELPDDLNSELSLLFTHLPYLLPAFAFVFMLIGGLLWFVGSIISSTNQNSDPPPYTPIDETISENIADEKSLNQVETKISTSSNISSNDERIDT